jgi:hypothetical protein
VGSLAGQAGPGRRKRGTKLWVGDYRAATSGAGVAEVLREKHLAESNLGVVGLRSQAPTEIYGAIPANFWAEQRPPSRIIVRTELAKL